MSTLYSVFQSQDAVPDRPARAVPNAFSWYAFLLTPIWAFHRGGWETFLVWCGAAIGLALLASLATFDTLLAILVVNLFFGFAARDVIAAHLSRMGFRETGLLLADSQIEAEVLAMNLASNAENAPRRDDPVGPWDAANG